MSADVPGWQIAGLLVLLGLFLGATGAGIALYLRDLVHRAKAWLRRRRGGR